MTIERLRQRFQGFSARLAQNALELVSSSVTVAHRYSNARGKFHLHAFDATANLPFQAGRQIEIGEGEVDAGAITVDFVAERVFFLNELLDRFTGLVYDALIAKQVGDFDRFGVKGEDIKVDTEETLAEVVVNELISPILPLPDAWLLASN
ncbi:hypothetical protein [Chloroflexus sp. Y-396-1]|uniref:hypothetical protein n=1 Tax=Chloroflexus sp. Y-396-1 TaxID=867845 RepID=UPI00049011CE|nr:hypothetical protein [Chloroflexus sp. Y-396-1]